jgi:tetratricopeptide (TPR) repeat protein
MSNMPAPDDLEALLTPNASPATVGLREQLQRRTAGTVRRRLWLRRGQLVFALAACYLAGMVTIDLMRSRPEPVAVGVLHTVPQKMVVIVPAEAPRAVEMRAEQAEPPEQAQVYFAAGKRYATEAGDWDSALRCYRNALDADPKQAEHIDPDHDDWLTMALKLDRQKEKENAKHEN